MIIPSAYLAAQTSPVSWDGQLLLPLHSTMTTMQLLHLLLTHPKDKSSVISRTAEAIAAYHALTTALAEAMLLTHPVPDAPTCIMMDASDTAVDAVLQKFICGHWHPISFSKVFKPVEIRFDRELFAMYLSLKHFHYCVEGCIFMSSRTTSHWYMTSTPIQRNILHDRHIV